MKYMLLMYANEAAAPSTPEEFQAVAQAWQSLAEDLQTAGVLISNNGLSSVSDATTIKVRDGKTIVADGPFAETHEQLGGYYLVDCKDLDEAIAWASRVPTASYGCIEIRPLNQWSQKA